MFLKSLFPQQDDLVPAKLIFFFSVPNYCPVSPLLEFEFGLREQGLDFRLGIRAEGFPGRNETQRLQEGEGLQLGQTLVGQIEDTEGEFFELSRAGERGEIRVGE